MSIGLLLLIGAYSDPGTGPQVLDRLYLNDKQALLVRGHGCG